jgi:p-cumate 2,3-dioxygenase beta subunit
MTTTFARHEIEDFLFSEAALLDDWKLEEWLALFTNDARYLVPSTDLPKDAPPEGNLFYIADDLFRISERVKRLMKKTAFSEQPRSKTRHLVSNVRLISQSADQCMATAAFITSRAKGGNVDLYVGSSEYTIVRLEGALRIRSKRCTLDMDALRPHGRISILL